MNQDEKMWYTVAEAQEYLHITETVLWRKILFLNIEARKLPGSKKDYISARDVKLIEQCIRRPDSIR